MGYVSQVNGLCTIGLWRGASPRVVLGSLGLAGVALVFVRVAVFMDHMHMPHGIDYCPGRCGSLALRVEGGRHVCFSVSKI